VQAAKTLSTRRNAVVDALAFVGAVGLVRSPLELRHVENRTRSERATDGGRREVDLVNEGLDVCRLFLGAPERQPLRLYSSDTWPESEANALT
jgi:hypothetical protein